MTMTPEESGFIRRLARRTGRTRREARRQLERYEQGDRWMPAKQRAEIEAQRADDEKRGRS
jgi:hypothetical protein